MASVFCAGLTLILGKAASGKSGMLHKVIAPAVVANIPTLYLCDAVKPQELLLFPKNTRVLLSEENGREILATEMEKHYESMRRRSIFDRKPDALLLVVIYLTKEPFSSREMEIDPFRYCRHLGIAIVLVCCLSRCKFERAAVQPVVEETYINAASMVSMPNAGVVDLLRFYCGYKRRKHITSVAETSPYAFLKAGWITEIAPGTPVFKSSGYRVFSPGALFHFRLVFSKDPLWSSMHKDVKRLLVEYFKVIIY